MRATLNKAACARHRRGAAATHAQLSKAAEAVTSVNTVSLRHSWVGCALTCLAAFAPVVTHAQATEAPSGAPLPPGLLANKCYTTPAPSSAVVPIESLTQIRTGSDVERLRAELIKQIWPGGFPADASSVTASPVTSGKDDPAASGLYGPFVGDRRSHMKSEQRLTIALGQGLVSVVYVWTPAAPNNRLFIVADGHTDSITNIVNYATVNTLLGLGFTVAWVQMPLLGSNLAASSPAAPFPANCRAGCDRHAAIFATYGAAGFRYFLEPVVVSLNYLLSHGRYRDVTMMGASGGGWTSLLAAAIDPRITYSASIAGSLPMHLRGGACGKPSLGDAEQHNWPGNLYSRITYVDLYIMAANGTEPDGTARKHLQINNQFDACCFFGITYQSYADALTKYVAERSLGDYSYHLNSTFVGHGYDFSKDTEVNHTLTDVVLPAIGLPTG